MAQYVFGWSVGPTGGLVRYALRRLGKPTLLYTTESARSEQFVAMIMAIGLR